MQLPKSMKVSVEILSIIHPYLFAIYPAIFLLSKNIHQDVDVFFVIIIILFILVITGIFLFITHLFEKDYYKTSIIVSITLLLFFFYGNFVELLSQARVLIDSYGITGLNRYLLPFWLLITCLNIVMIHRIKSDFKNIAKYLNISSFILIAFSVGSLFYNYFHLTSSGTSNYDDAYYEFLSKDQYLKNNLQPNIYYIILDGYASTSTLNDLYNYDNSDFVAYLNREGFFVAAGSKSNYSSTLKSLCSSLNLCYINHISDAPPEAKSDKAMQRLIRNSRVFNFLKSRGYSVEYYGTYSNLGMENKVQLNVSGNEFLVTLLEMTMFRPFLSYYERDNKEIRKRILFTFSNLAKLKSDGKPKFIFAHIIVPHPPFVFGRNGECVDEVHSSLSHGWEHKQLYLNQLIYVNKMIKKLIEEILSESKTSPIIIVQSDHGPASELTANNNQRKKINNPPIKEVQERMGILNAYYLPQKVNLLYNTISPVNTFRVIFNNYFDQKYRLLEDKHYYSSYIEPFNFIDVTEMSQ